MSAVSRAVRNMAILQHYWSDGATVRRIARTEGNLSLAEKLAWQDAMRRHLDAGAKRLRVLEIGSAAGALSMLLAKLRHQVTGVDFSEPLVELARQRAAEAEIGCTFVHAHAHELNFENGQFDAIVAVNTLKLLPEPRIALESWQRVLKPGGRLIVVCDALDSADTQKFLRAQEQTDPSALVKYYVQMRDNLPMWHGDSAEMRALLEIAGFENVVQTGLAGQLAREGKWRFQQYSAGYSVFSADNPGSIPLTTL